MKSLLGNLVKKYDQPVPRYTSYPTVPFWNSGLDINHWKKLLKQQVGVYNSKEGVSLYIHMPFCESLCAYCGCNKRITTNHHVETEYLDALEKEWKVYLALIKETPVIRELHLGGGTPTFFSPRNLEKMMAFIKKRSIIHPRHEFSIEGHPNNTTREHLETLYQQGFRRISYGVQDHDPEVQRIINRIQPLENVRRATEEARAVGFLSVNFDLIYGLPKQSISSIQKTIEQTIELKPDRIAFYSYAHVPWTSRGQRLFDETELPTADEKLELYLKGKEMFTAAGYVDIGMDHFALPHDDLFKAKEKGTLHRNFMGYTTQQTSILLGLGVSSISDIGIAFAQNKKSLHDYYETVSNNELPLFKGYFLSEEDIAFRKYILNISCKGETFFEKKHLPELREFVFPRLTKLEKDGLITWNETKLKITPLGSSFIRNICSAFDLRMIRQNMEEAARMFSKAI